jgi:hypothetical protein
MPVVAANLAILSIALSGLAISLAMYSAQAQSQAVLHSKAIFPNERVSPAFRVGDASSGTQVDRSSSFAFAADGLTTTTSPWATSFATNRYLDFDLNHPLASGIAVAGATFDFTFASSGSGQACFYFEVRRISTGAVLATHGSAASPIGCVTGTTLTSFSTAIASMATTAIANDLRIRVFGREAGGLGSVIDLARVVGSTPYQSFTLYPILVTDAADTIPKGMPWGLQAP